jgi:hypothetical protein
MLKFFHSDYAVQERTINVIATVLQFSSQETDDLRKAWQNQLGISSTFNSFGQVTYFNLVLQKWHYQLETPLIF